MINIIFYFNGKWRKKLFDNFYRYRRIIWWYNLWKNFYNKLEIDVNFYNLINIVEKKFIVNIFVNLDKLIWKFIWKVKELRSVKMVLVDDKVGRFVYLDNK